MANGKKGPKMDHKVVKRLLDGLSTDEGFRKKFQEDPAGTLDSIGYQAPTDDTEMAAGQCLTLQANQSLAPAEEIARDRDKIESLMSGIFGFIGTTGLTR